MSYSRLAGVLVSGVMLFGLVSCGGAAGAQYLAISLHGEAAAEALISQAESGGGEEFEAIRQAADTYVNSGNELSISAKQLYDSMRAVMPVEYETIWYDPLTYSRGPFILDVRSFPSEADDLYVAGHVPGSLHIPYQQITLFKNFKNLPKERQIVVVSGTGEIGAQVTAVLSVLGFDAVNLMWGMTSWTGDATVVPASYDKTRDTVSSWGAYYASGATPEPEETHPLPVVENTESSDRTAIILAAADAYLADGSRRFDMTSRELYQALTFSPQTAAQLFLSTFFTGTPTGSPYTVPFVLDIRDSASFNKGHLGGAVHVYFKDVFKTGNLEKLPADRPVLVYGDNGHESSAVTALLNLLGYDATNLRWGIAADQFVPARDCMNYDFVTGFGAFIPCPT